MSYILEALKKSEQQRNHAGVPDLQTIHLPAPMQPAVRIWPYIVIVLLLVSLAFVIGWIQPWKSPAPLAQQNVPEPQAIAAPVAVSPQPTTSQAAPQAAQTATIATPQPQSLALTLPKSMEQPALPDQGRSDQVSTPSLDIESVPHLSEMPALIQQGIPQMSFAGHVYSSNAEQRSVIINGHSMAEGDVVIRGLVIEQITSDGVIFNYQDQLFRMQILQDWSFN